MDGYQAATYGERWADVYDDWYPPDTDVDACVAALAAMAAERDGAGIVVELGVGTGRVAVPLAARGVDVRGIDASAAMLGVLRRKDPAGRVTVAVADMADIGPDTVPGAHHRGSAEPPVVVVFASYNTFFALGRAEAQHRCLCGIATTLAPGGRFAMEAFVPDPDAIASGRHTVSVRSMGVDHLVLTADRTDPDTQTVSGQFVELSDGSVHLRPFHLRYLLPDQLDTAAAEAGLVLEHRHADWARTPFTEASDRHVSVYRRA